MSYRMTEVPYDEPLQSFDLTVTSADTYEVDIIGQGKAALAEANQHMGKYQL